MDEVKQIIISAISSEKAISLIQKNNSLTFIVDGKANKIEIRKEIERLFNVKVEKVNTMWRNNRKIAIVKLKKESNATDLASKLGIL
ncbi:MAG: 50S ribosomal protein L23 [Candidatus Rehaiarchaeum fermentans]|nr:50S ribosomal protein L23 [Candidatus Rehaiarchaeum fermentans]MCW1292319.1 50S ribosomal protein L23 [Candidatus Rehaiarchaeum fermentans]MCW1293128.1 50S ribosomal protein L23 [Candidatus Rehaiarchaeum fermentans]MCW1293667.1 50S ribosomal protein L23 [Candidatus Rehaiarchaeum fermentans]MCW1297251.1 50S ribosomal protein L23 [Candidatus Rehaiarchaeum fermentans]